KEAAARLDWDADFQADVLVSKYVLAISAAMQERGIRQSVLAKMWGKTRQYLNKLLNEDRRVNFTVHTMVKLAMLLKRRIRIEVEEIEEPALERKQRHGQNRPHSEA